MQDSKDLLYVYTSLSAIEIDSKNVSGRHMHNISKVQGFYIYNWSYPVWTYIEPVLVDRYWWNLRNVLNGPWQKETYIYEKKKLFNFWLVDGSFHC